MDIKKFLRRIRHERTELELLLLKRDNITVIHGLTYTQDKVISSVDGDLSEMAIKNARLLNEIDKKISYFKDNQNKALDMIYSLNDSIQRQIMVMYYLSRKEIQNSRLTSPYSLEDVADSLNISFDYVRHIHGDAINILRHRKSRKPERKTIKKPEKKKALA